MVHRTTKLMRCSFLLLVIMLYTCSLLSRPARASQVEILIVTSSQLLRPVNELAEFKNSTGVLTVVRTTDNIGVRYHGRDMPEKIRNCIRDLHESLGVRWIILAGDVEHVPTRLIYNPEESWVSAYPEEYVATDYYYAGLHGDWDADRDGKFGENQTNCAEGIDEADFTIEVSVGRLPASTPDEMKMIVDKIRAYVVSQGADEQRFRRVLFFAAHVDKPFDSEKYCRYVYDQSGMGSVATPRLTLSMKSGNLSMGSAKQYFNDGYGIVVSTGHGNPYAIYADGKTYFDTAAARAASNAPIYSFWFMTGCNNGAFDEVQDCLAEVLLYSPGGCIGVIAHSRISWGKRPFGMWYPESGEFDYVWRFWKKVFSGEVSNPGEALYRTKEDHALRSQYTKYLQCEWVRRDLFGVNLIGDPSIDLVKHVVILEFSDSSLFIAVFTTMLTTSLLLKRKKSTLMA